MNIEDIINQSKDKMLGIIVILVIFLMVTREIVIQFKHIKKKKARVNEFDQLIMVEE